MAATVVQARQISAWAKLVVLDFRAVGEFDSTQR